MEEKTRNTLKDLNNHLFMQLERLNDDDLNGDKLREEVIRSKAITGIAKEIIANANTVLEAKKFASDIRGTDETVPRMLEG